MVTLKVILFVLAWVSILIEFSVAGILIYGRIRKNSVTESDKKRLNRCLAIFGIIPIVFFIICGVI